MKGIKIVVENEEPYTLPCDVIDALVYALYYSANPESEMYVPNCAYIHAEKMFEKKMEGGKK